VEGEVAKGKCRNSKMNNATNLNATFDKVATVRNTTFLFWVALALFLLYHSYAPINLTENIWLRNIVKVLFKSTMGLWVYADGRARNFSDKWHATYYGLSILIPEIALPIYLVHSRGWLGAGKSALRFTGYILLALVIWVAMVGILQLFGVHEVGPQLFPSRE